MSRLTKQYTGLKDKNGVKIFEGDIVKVDFMPYTYEIYFTMGGFRAKSKDFDFPIHAFLEENDLEVIGNIYENKELLKI